jgi:biopolymer transport protein ExbD
MSASSLDNHSAEPNLTPLLDVVFQLITFFMLVINFTNDNYDQRIKLPVAGSARPLDDPKAVEDDRLVLNIDKHGDLLLNGKSLRGPAAAEKIKFEAQLVRLNKKALNIKGKAEDDGLPTRIVIRADKDTECGPIYTIISTCQANGFRKFDFKAMVGP